MTKRRFVREKTLELNLSAEVLSSIRVKFPRAFLLGMTQEREGRNGIDAVIQSVHQMIGAIQYKAPFRPRNDGKWRFALQERQLYHLQSLGKRFPGKVAYFLPRVATRDESRDGSPAFLPITNTLAVGIVSPGRHRVVVDATTTIVFSEERHLDIVTGERLLREWAISPSMARARRRTTQPQSRHG